MERPPQFDREHAGRWRDRDAARAYRFRPSYHPAAFDVLIELIGDRPRVVLDVGCGTGAVARPLAPRVARIDAIDLASEMIEEGRALPGGDAPNIRWTVASAEEAPLDPPYALITAGQSLHWMRWEVALPRFAASLMPEGVVAVLGIEEPTPPPWQAELQAIIVRHSTARGYAPLDLFETLERAGLWTPLGDRTSEPVELAQPVEDFIASHHAMSSLTRARIDAPAFDAELRALFSRCCPDGVVRRSLATRVAWARPTRG